MLPYCTEDLVIGRRLLDVGCEALMPWGAPIGTGKGVVNPYGLRVLRERLPDVPLIVDAKPACRHACQVMEWGFDGVLLNTAVSQATHPEIMARAFAQGVEAGRAAYLAGPMDARETAHASTRSSGCRSGTRTEAAHERAFRRCILAAGRRTGRSGRADSRAARRLAARAAPWRLCVAVPDVPADGDVLIVSAGDRAAQARVSAVAPAAPGAVAIEFDEQGAVFHTAGARYALDAAHPLGDDWIAALAAFLDCGFAPIDALVLALARRR